jgi:hypothetical protein
MRKLLITAALIASISGGMALAQQTRVTTTIITPVPVVNPETSVSRSVPQPLPTPETTPSTIPDPDGIVREWGPQQPVAQAVPAPPAAYPPCTRGRTDSCYNPDPHREADTRADGTVGG